MADTEDFGKRLKLMRMSRHWTQKELAHHSGLSRTHVSRLEEKRKQKLTEPTISGLAQAFGYSLDAFLREVGLSEVPIPRETAKELMDKARAAMPIGYPVYKNIDVKAGEGFDLTGEFHYMDPVRVAGRNIHILKVKGHCLAPMISDGNWVVIDANEAVELGDIIIYQWNHEYIIGKLESVSNELWVVNNDHKIKCENYRWAAPVIEVVRRLK